jgi:TonB family protein
MPHVRQHRDMRALCPYDLRRVLARAAALVFLLTFGAAAQPAGIISGIVVDATTRAPLSDAVVTARSPALLGEQTAVTDESGLFEMTMLSPGTYALSLQHSGYAPFAPEGIVVRDRRVRVRVRLVREGGSVDSASASIVEFDEATMTRPALISGPEPEYTQEAIERAVHGPMTVKCVVGADGTVRKCRVLKGLPFMNDAVVDALSQRRYKPATARGRPVDVYYTFNLRLTLPQHAAR